MLVLTIEQKTWMHALPAWVKLALLALMSAMLFPVTSIPLLLIMLFGVVILYASLGWRVAKQGLSMLLPLIPMIGLLLLFHMVYGGVLEGIAIALRLVSLVALANCVTMTTRLMDMMRVVEFLLTPLQWLGFNPRIFSLACAMVIRFTPVLMERAEIVSDAWYARSAKKPRWRIIPALGLSAIDDADYVADALRARGGVDMKNREVKASPSRNDAHF